MENFSEIFDITDKETYDKYSVCKKYSTYVLKNNKVLLQTGKGDSTKWLEIIEEDEYLILELDSWQLQGFGDMKISPHIAVFTSFMDDHMNYYKDDLKKYVEYCADNALKELGMKPNWNVLVNPLPYMDDVVGSIQADFFSSRVTDYTKEIEGSWDKVDFSKWRA